MPKESQCLQQGEWYRMDQSMYFRRVNSTTFEGSIVPQKIKHAPRSIISIPQRAVNGTTERALVTSERSEWYHRKGSCYLREE